jgi:hypothetical protein
MVVMPLTLSANQGAALIRRKGIADVDGNVARNGRFHGLRMNDLGAEVSEFHRLVVRQLIDDLRIGNEPWIRRQDPVHIGPNDDFRRVQQRAENRAGEIAAVAPQGGLHTGRRRRDEPRHDEPPLESWRDQTVEVSFARGPLYSRSQGSPFDDDDVAGVHPAHVAGNAGAL